MRIATGRYLRTWVGLSLIVVLPCSAEEPVKTLAPVEVIGTRLKRTDWETPLPVRVLSREEIRASGAVSVAELLSAVSMSNGGSIHDVDRGSSFSSGVSTVSLRGLGSHATLVLLNGRRLAPAPADDPNAGQSHLVNLNFIPLAAIERIEVLPGGASAIYGSDAVAGVVNIVLRQDSQTAEAGVRYSFNQDGAFGNRSVHGVLGFGDGAGFSATLVIENAHRSATGVSDARGVPAAELTRLFNRNTPAASTLSYPGNLFTESVPGNGAFTQFYGPDPRCPPAQLLASGRCGYNLHAPMNSIDPREGNALAGRASLELHPALTLFSEFTLARTDNTFISPARAVLESGTVWFAEDGRRNLFRFILPAGHPDNPAGVPVALRYRFADVGPLRRDTSTDSGRLLLGAKGMHGGWEWESALSYMRVKTSHVDRGLLHFQALSDAIASGAYRPFGNNAAQTLAAVSPEVRDSGKSAHTGWDLKGTRILTELEGGPLALATGVELRHEQLRVTPDARVVNGEFIGVGATGADGSRHVRSLFAELSAPFVKRVETQFALRHDRYSDFGNATTPHVGMKWKPADMVALRGSYAKGFRAPSLSTISNSSVTAFAQGLADTLRCGQAGSTEDDCFFTGSMLIRANPRLEPEKSDSQTLGLILAPTPDIDVGINFYRIERRKEVGFLDPQFTIDNEARFPGAIARNPDPATWLPGVPNSGPIQSTTLRFFNLGSTITRGVDVDAALRHSLGAWGRLKAQFNGSYLIGYKTRLTASDPYLATQGALGPAGELPRFKGNLSVTWNYRSYTVTGRVNHVSGWRFGDGTGACFSGNAVFRDEYRCRVKPWTTLDLHLGYTGIRNLELGLAVRNIQDKPAPLDPTALYTALGYNPAFHNPFGRYFSLWMNYKFK